MVSYPHTDRLGSTIALSKNGAAAEKFSYGPYGESASPATGYQWRYTGQRWNPFTQLYHYKAREYSPELGRFLQNDPLGFVEGPNMYSYVANEPVNSTDPDGLQAAAEAAQRARTRAQLNDGVNDSNGTRYKPRPERRAKGATVIGGGSAGAAAGAGRLGVAGSVTSGGAIDTSGDTVGFISVAGSATSAGASANVGGTVGVMNGQVEDMAGTAKQGGGGLGPVAVLTFSATNGSGELVEGIMITVGPGEGVSVEMGASQTYITDPTPVTDVARDAYNYVQDNHVGILPEQQSCTHHACDPE